MRALPRSAGALAHHLRFVLQPVPEVERVGDHQPQPPVHLRRVFQLAPDRVDFAAPQVLGADVETRPVVAGCVFPMPVFDVIDTLREASQMEWVDGRKPMTEAKGGGGVKRLAPRAAERLLPALATVALAADTERPAGMPATVKERATPPGA